MKRWSVPLLCLLLAVVAFPAVAQGTMTLAIAASPAKVDGVFGEKEYSVVTEAQGMKLGLTWTAETLYVGISAPTAGWVSAGFGSAKMDGAVMYIAYATGDAAEMKVQKGAGHRHADIETDAPQQYAIKEAGGKTTLELALDPSTAIAKDQKALDVIFAMGGSDSFVSFHKAKSSITVSLSR